MPGNNYQHQLYFPHPEFSDKNGILAIGGDLSEERLKLAYNFGIFPWYNPGEPIIWWCPDPRFVLYPSEVRISKSMRNIINRNKFKISLDTSFEAVIENCKSVQRPGQSGTWITSDMKKAYMSLHKSGLAHSLEVWKNGQLVGGLYGLSFGKVFFGESMFALESNASKFGFIRLCEILDSMDFYLIDCQQATRHLESLGGKFIPRNDFLKVLEQNRRLETIRGSWSDLVPMD